MREFYIFKAQLKAFARLFITLPLVFGFLAFAFPVIVVFVLGESFPVKLGLWPLDNAGFWYEGYRFFSILLPFLYAAWVVLLLGFFLRQTTHRVEYKHQGAFSQEDVQGNRSLGFLIFSVIVGIGYFFLHRVLTNSSSPIPNIALYVLQLTGFLLPEGVFYEQAENELPIITMFLLIFAGLFVLVGSGLG